MLIFRNAKESFRRQMKYVRLFLYLSRCTRSLVFVAYIASRAYLLFCCTSDSSNIAQGLMCWTCSHTFHVWIWVQPPTEQNHTCDDHTVVHTRLADGDFLKATFLGQIWIRIFLASQLGDPCGEMCTLALFLECLCPWTNTALFTKGCVKQFPVTAQKHHAP